MASTLLVGPINTLLANVVYALPARATFGYTDNTNLEVSNAVGSGFVAVTVTAGTFASAAAFIRCTSGTALVTVKAIPGSITIGGGSGSGDVTAVGILTANALIIGQGTTSVAASRNWN